MNSELYKQTEEFNRIAGNLDEQTDEAFFVGLGNQINYIVEELEETVRGFENADGVEVLDGLVDVLVTAYGALQKLQVKGVDVQEAQRRIGENNLSKVTMSLQDALITQESYQEKGIATKVVQDPVTGTYAVKRISDNKIMKPWNFTAVDLSDLVPERFKEGYILD